jgi:hypothetical protein
LKQDAAARFMAKVEKNDATGCWEWTAGRKGGGYGIFFFLGSLRGAHRVALALFRGFPIDSVLHVMHSCDNPGCVNPEHLSCGTHSDNMKDASKKGRIVNPNDWSGTRNPKSKLSGEQRKQLEGEISAGKGSREISVKYGVSRVRVQQIRRELAA